MAAEPDIEMALRHLVAGAGTLAKSLVRDGMPTERATHLLLFYLGSDACRPLVHDFGWTHEAWVDWTVATTADLVFAASSNGRSG
jgi:hypothetical protein